MRFLGLILTAVAFLGVLMLGLLILGLDNPRQATMSQFYLSIPLTLLLSYLFAAAGRAHNLAVSSGGVGWARRVQDLGFPLGHVHAWGDFGRLYALLFLVFIAPVILAAFPTLIANNVVGFEQTVDISTDGTGLSETEAFQQIGTEQIDLIPADQAKFETVMQVASLSYVIGLILIMPCFAKLIPFYFWRSGGRAGPNLAETWRRVPWGLALSFGLVLVAGLALSLILPSPLIARYIFVTLFIAIWAILYARWIGPYDTR